MRLDQALRVMKQVNGQIFSSRLRLIHLGDEVILCLMKNDAIEPSLKSMKDFASQNGLFVTSEKEYYSLSDSRPKIQSIAP